MMSVVEADHTEHHTNKVLKIDFFKILKLLNPTKVQPQKLTSHFSRENANSTRLTRCRFQTVLQLDIHCKQAVTT